MDLLDTQLYDLVGEEGFVRLVGAFYRRVPGDDILGALYPRDDLAGAEQRLRGELRELQAELRIPVLLITHDDDDVRTLADDVVHLLAGRVANAESSRAEVTLA